MTDRLIQPRIFEARAAFDLRPRKDNQQTGIPLFRRSCPTAIATDVFPNPGEPQIDTSWVVSEVKWPMISSHSLWRPVKQGTILGREVAKGDGLTPLDVNNKE